MKKFLLKVSLFFFLVVASVAVFVVFETAVRSRVSLELPRDKTVLFIGDSHIVNGINDKLIPGAFNWAQGGENYLNLFPRMKKLLEANPQIRTVFITATPRSLSKDADSWIFNGDSGALFERSVIFYEPRDLEDCREIIATALKNPRPQRIAALRATRAKTFGTLGEFGGFEDLGNSSELLWKEIENNGKLGKKKRFSRGDKNCGNAMTIKYLRKIVEFVRARGVKIIFLNPPLYHAEEFFDVPYYEAALKEKFPDVEVWDYGNYPMPEDCFKDVSHLNGRGAEIFSKELERRMREEGIIDD